MKYVYGFKQLVNMIASGSPEYFNEDRIMWLEINWSYDRDKITYAEHETLYTLADAMAKMVSTKSN